MYFYIKKNIIVYFYALFPLSFFSCNWKYKLFWSVAVRRLEMHYIQKC